MEVATEVFELLSDDYIGDELTMEDLQQGYSAFLEDEKLENVSAMEFA
jgi:hypothetical protein